MSADPALVLTPARLVEVILDRLQRAPSVFNAYWVCVPTNREEYAAKLRETLGGHRVCVLVVRGVHFSDPNSILFDLIRVIEENRALCLPVMSTGPSDQFGVVLLSRTPLSVPQVSSPVNLPDWFPEIGGHTVSVEIEDLSVTADAPLNCEEANIGDISHRLFELEGVLLHRLVDSYDYEKDSANAFRELIRRDTETVPYRDLLATFNASRRAVAVATAFRPSLRDGTSLIARLWAMGHQRNPEDGAPSKALASALRLPSDIRIPRDSFASLIRRPSSPVHKPALQFARNTLATVASSCQLITAAAHADAYARYPFNLLMSYSYDLRVSLGEIRSLIAMQAHST